MDIDIASYESFKAKKFKVIFFKIFFFHKLIKLKKKVIYVSTTRSYIVTLLI